MKVVINVCYGGFSISLAAAQFMAQRGNTTAIEELAKYEAREDKRWSGHCRDLKRDDSDLVAAVETLESAANGYFADLKVVEIPDGIEWEVEEYDGLEHIAEAHRTWS